MATWPLPVLKPKATPAAGSTPAPAAAKPAAANTSGPAAAEKVPVDAAKPAAANAPAAEK